jgi:hypothetical protein
VLIFIKAHFMVIVCCIEKSSAYTFVAFEVHENKSSALIKAGLLHIFLKYSFVKVFTCSKY